MPSGKYDDDDDESLVAPGDLLLSLGDQEILDCEQFLFCSKIC